jgi:hypothetical protein
MVLNQKPVLFLSTKLLWRALDIVDCEGNFADLLASLSNC